MKAMHLANAAPATALVPDEVPQPGPGRGELLIRVCAAGIIPTELTWYPTTHTQAGEARKGAIPAHEFSGVVAALGEEVGSLEEGQEVFGMNDWFADGALAEYCCAPFFAVAPKPRSLTHAEAASVPISGLTAWQGLFDHARLQAGERVLIHGGAGGVGSFAIQLARIHGAHVLTTAAERNRSFVWDLGAEQVIDYREQRFEDYAKEVDVVFDTVGGETLERSWSVLKPGGRLVTVVSSAENPADPRVKEAFFIVEPNQKQLVELAALLDAGRLRTVVDTVVRWPQAAEVYSGRLERQGRGKVVVAVAEEGQTTTARGD